MMSSRSILYCAIDASEHNKADMMNTIFLYNISELFSDVSGICENEFFKYYLDVEEGFAIKIDNLVIFDEFIDMNMFDEFKAPQSFCYVENNDCLKELLLT